MASGYRVGQHGSRQNQGSDLGQVNAVSSEKEVQILPAPLGHGEGSGRRGREGSQTSTCTKEALSQCFWNLGIQGTQVGRGCWEVEEGPEETYGLVSGLLQQGWGKTDPSPGAYHHP